MSTIKLTLPAGESPVTGKQVSFVAPCDCSVADYIQISGTDYSIVDAAGCAIKGTGAWVNGALITVTLDTSNAKAYVQNAAIPAIAVDTALDSASTNPVQNKVITSALLGKAPTSHGNHVPTTETANNARFLRNDNTWQTITPANIGAMSQIFQAGTSAPSDTKLLWIDTTATTGGLKYYNGSSWVHVPVAYT